MSAIPEQIAQFDQLLYALLLEGLSADEEARLDELVANDVALRRRYLERMFVVGELSFASDQATPANATVLATSQSLTTGPSGSVPALRNVYGTVASLNRPVVWATLAAGILFAAYVVTISWNMLGRERSDRSTASSTNGPDDSVATITASEDAKWEGASATRLTASSTHGLHEPITPSEPLRISSGLVELQLKQGTTLLIEGPADWKIDGENSATLTRGKLVARVPQQAIGFTLETPAARIVDLGTEFGVEVGTTNATEVHVLKGRVEAHADSGKEAGLSLPLQSGESLRINADGTQSPVSSSTVNNLIRLAEGKPSSARTKHSSATRQIDVTRDTVASQSSDYVGRDSRAQFAIDGNLASFTCTGAEDANAWWQLDLGKTRTVAVVMLHNRQDQCRGRLRDITISVIAEDGKTETARSPVLNSGNEAWGGGKDINQGPARLVFDLTRTSGGPAAGRYVRVERAARDLENEVNRNVLSIGEVEVFEPRDSLENRSTQ